MDAGEKSCIDLCIAQQTYDTHRLFDKIAKLLVGLHFSQNTFAISLYANIRQQMFIFLYLYIVPTFI